MRKTVFYSLAAVLLLVAAVWVPSRTFAASGAGSKILTITPATTKPTINPGTAASGKFQIINQGAGDYPVRIYAAPYTVHSEDYTPDFSPIPGKPNAANWLHFTVSTATVAPGQTINVGYTITVPAGTTPGGYYAVAFAETRSTSTGQQGVVVNERVGEIFYIRVAGKVQQSGKVLSWASPFLQKPPLGATLRLENDGGLDYASAIHITVSDLFGRPKYSLNTSKEVLPQTIRRIPASWTAAPPLGLFKVTGTATVAGQTQQLSTHYVLVVSPTVRIVGLALVAVLVAYGLGRKLIRRQQRDNTTES